MVVVEEGEGAADRTTPATGVTSVGRGDTMPMIVQGLRDRLEVTVEGHLGTPGEWGKNGGKLSLD